MEATAVMQNPQHNGYSPDAVGPVWSSAWTATFAGGALTNTVIADGDIFVGVTQGAQLGVYAYQASTGQPLWGPLDVGGAPTSLTYDSGQLFVASGAGVESVNPTTAAPNWIRNLGSSLSDTAANGELAVVGVGGLVVLDESNGSTIWSDNAYFNAPVAIDGSTIFADSGGTCSAFDASTGSVLWSRASCGNGSQLDAGGDDLTAPAWNNDGQAIGQISSETTGDLIRDYTSVEDPASDGSNLITSPTAGSLDDEDLATGVGHWNALLGADLIAPPLIVGNSVYAESSFTGTGSTSGVSAYDLNSGRFEWSSQLPTNTFAAEPGMSEGDGVLAVPDGDALAVFTPSPVPGVPAAPVATATNGGVDLAWTVPPDSGDAITQFQVTVSGQWGLVSTITLDAAGGDLSPTPGDQDSYQVVGLTIGQPYTFTVAAINSAGSGGPSPSSIQVTAAVVPDAPSEVSAVAGYDQAQVYWTVAGDGGDPIISWVVTPFISGTPQTPITYTPPSPPGPIPVMASLSATPGSNDDAVVLGLVPGLDYTFSVTATTAIGESPSSSPSNEVTPTDTPGVPLPPAAPAATTTGAAADVSWTVPAEDGLPVTDFLVNTIRDGTPVGAPIDVPNLGGNSEFGISTYVPDLSAGSSYTFTVVAVNADGDSVASPQSNAVEPTTIPGAPRDVYATSVGNQTVWLTWLPPTSDGGSQLTEYVISDGPTNWTVVLAQYPQCAEGQQCSYAVSGLTNGATYDLTVTAVNENGTGPPSQVAVATPFGVPAAPTGIAVSAPGGQVHLSWAVPNDEGSPIVAFLVTPVANGVTGSAITETAGTPGVSNVYGATDSVAVPSLHLGWSYAFSVQAVNGAGTGPPSLLSGAIVPSGPPEAPQDLHATTGRERVKLTWTVPADQGSAITSYSITVAERRGATWTERVAGGTLSDPASPPGASAQATILHLTGGRRYSFSVTAVNADGSGKPSAASTVLVVGPSQPPTDVRIAVSGGQADLSWSAPSNTGGTPLTGYVITCSDGSRESVAVTRTSANVTALAPAAGGEFRCKVAAINRFGTSAPSPWTRWVTLS